MQESTRESIELRNHTAVLIHQMNLFIPEKTFLQNCLVFASELLEYV